MKEMDAIPRLYDHTDVNLRHETVTVLEIAGEVPHLG